MKIDFYGHACVGVSGSKKILIDPYLSGNPSASLTAEQAAERLRAGSDIHFRESGV